MLRCPLCRLCLKLLLIPMFNQVQKFPCPPPLDFRFMHLILKIIVFLASMDFKAFGKKHFGVPTWSEPFVWSLNSLDIRNSHLVLDFSDCLSADVHDSSEVSNFLHVHIENGEDSALLVDYFSRHVFEADKPSSILFL